MQSSEYFLSPTPITNLGGEPKGDDDWQHVFKQVADSNYTRADTATATRIEPCQHASNATVCPYSTQGGSNAEDDDCQSIAPTHRVGPSNCLVVFSLNA
jgi:hypothetical protein